MEKNEIREEGRNPAGFILLLSILTMIFLVNFISAFDEQATQICGGDEELQVLCMGDAGNAPISSPSGVSAATTGVYQEPLKIPVTEKIGKAFEKSVIPYLLIGFFVALIIFISCRKRILLIFGKKKEEEEKNEK